MEPSYLNELLGTLRQTVAEGIHRRFRSTEDFAKDAGVNQSSLSRYLRGERSLSLETFLRIAYRLELDLGELFPFGKKGLSIHESTAPEFSDTARRRRKVTVLLSETSVVEIKRNSRKERPLLELKID